MERILLVHCFLLSVLILWFGGISVAAPHENLQTDLRLNGNKKPDDTDVYLWFGPRVGRKKRNHSEQDGYEDVDSEEFENLMELLQGTPWAFFPLKERKRQTLNFTPRLGRSSEEFYPSKTTLASLLQDPKVLNALYLSPKSERRAPFYTPRLGRNNEKN